MDSLISKKLAYHGGYNIELAAYGTDHDQIASL